MAILPGDDGPYVFASKVPPEYDGFRLLDYFADRFAYQDRDAWSGRIASGDVRVDSAVETASGAILRKDASVEYVHGQYREPETPTGWKVVAMAQEWMAVHKPAGMPMQSTPRIFRQTLVWQVRRLFGEGWSPVHRLDRETSGLVVFARGRQATTWLNKAFSQRQVSKDYLALVRGTLDAPVEIDGAIGPAQDPAAPIRQAVREDGKEARTTIRPIAADEQERGTWVVASPHQGRMHQIRVHCESIGHPIVGDPLYDGRDGAIFKARAAGAASRDWSDLSGGERLHLHAWRLRFDRPGPALLPMVLICPMPEEWMVPRRRENGTLGS